MKGFPYTTAIIPGAGMGLRMGKDKHKMLIEIDGARILQRTLQALKDSGRIDAFVVVLREDDIPLVEAEILPAVFDRSPCRIIPCLGGESRMDSIKNGLAQVPGETEIILSHDGARPFISTAVIDRTLERLLKKDCDGVVPVLPMKDTVKYADEDMTVMMTPNRSRLYAAQTPQVFWRHSLLRAYRQAENENVSPTDDAQLVEIMGGKVTMVAGDEANIKITTPQDLLLGEWILHGQAANPDF